MKPKLVRDRIPSIIFLSGNNPHTHVATTKEYRKALGAKLVEEAREFEKSGDISELADILEVIHAILKERKIRRAHLTMIAREKRNERGGFRKKIILDRVGQ